MSTASAPCVALVGAPNCGKSALFNALTGSRQKVANYPGVTVERKIGSVSLGEGRTAQVLDLPGTYSLDAHSPEEEITRDILLGRQVDRADIVVAVADATNLERSLGMVLELKALGLPLVLALNMVDLAEQRGLRLDVAGLSERLGVPVIPTVAIRREGVERLVQSLQNPPVADSAGNLNWEKPTAQEIRDRFRRIDGILKEVTLAPRGPASTTEGIDRVLLHPVWGNAIMLLVLAIIFQAVFTWAAPLMDLIEGGMEALSGAVVSTLPDGPLRSLLVDGIIAGVGAVVVFLPQIVLLFLFILILEETGYMARAAFLMDRTMGAMGLHGRAFIPLLSSFACAIPGVLATRTIDSPRDRLATILVAPLMTCSARLPVYTLLIAAFIPNSVVVGPIRLQGLVMLGLYLAGVFSALGVAWLLKLTALKGHKPPLLLELPTYKIPSWRNVALGLWERARMFLKRAGTLIFAVAVCLWFLASYPTINGEPAPISESYAGRIGHFIEPAVRPLGFSWEIATGLIPGFAAREVMVGALATIYAVGGDEANEEAQERALGERLIGSWSLATALALLAWYIFSPQCLATFAVMRRETQSLGWTAFGFTYLLVLAYLAALVTYQTALALGVG